MSLVGGSLIDLAINIFMIFSLSFFMLFLIYSMRNESRYFMIYMSGYFSVLLGYILFYVHRTTSDDNRGTEFRVVNFILVYSIVLVQALAVVFYNILRNNYMDTYRTQL